MQKILASLAMWAMVWGLSLAVMIYGWGLSPKSWPWIIVGGLGVWLLSVFHALTLGGKS